MGELVLVLGGARSGKSNHALELAKAQGRRAAYIATCEAKDKELEDRVALHKASRPRGWKTFEEPIKVAKLIREIGRKYDILLIDCLSFLVSNMMMKGFGEKDIRKEVLRIAAAAKSDAGKVIVVSNEVGLGIVPATKLGRDFRDIAGRANQDIAKNADEVIFMVSGLPWRIK